MRLQTPSDGYVFILFGIVLCIVGIAISVRKSSRIVGLTLIAACAGFCLGVAHGISNHQLAETIQSYSGEVVVELLEDSLQSGYGESALVRATFPGGVQSVLDARFGDVEPLIAGRRFSCRTAFVAYDFEQRPHAWADGSIGALKVLAFERADMNPALDSLVSFRESAITALGNQTDAQRLLQALVCGYRHDIRDSELYSSFQTCGLAHLVAVSGAHLVIVTGLFAGVLRSLRVPRRITIAALVLVMASYFVVAGMPISALRAIIMSALGLASFFGKRRASSLNAVGVGVFAIVLSHPPSCLSASFALSGLSTIGIVLFAPLVNAWFAKTPLAGVPLVSEALSLTLSAGILSQLYAASLFSQIPLISPISNIIVTPLFPFVCGSGLVFVLVEVLLPFLAPIAQIFSQLSSLLIAGMVDMLSRVPYASVPICMTTPVAVLLSFLAACSLWLLWPRTKRVVIMLLAVGFGLALGFALPLGDSDRIVMLDIGQGDAFLVQSRGQRLLVDTGNEDGKLLSQLARNGVVHLDAVLITHADDDHRGSLDALNKAVQVDSVLLASGMEQCHDPSVQALLQEAYATARKVEYLNCGDEFSVGAFRARVVWPDALREQGGNADSLCTLLEYDGDDDGVTDYVTFMTGDAEKDEVGEMLKSNRVGHVDVLKVGHHGSRNGATKNQVEALSPSLALISCGKNNRYGHPAPETLEMLESVGAQTYRTDSNGMVTCLFAPSSIRVACSK